jgi:hypothetical protein
MTSSRMCLTICRFNRQDDAKNRAAWNTRRNNKSTFVTFDNHAADG